MKVNRYAQVEPKQQRFHFFGDCCFTGGGTKTPTNAISPPRPTTRTSSVANERLNAWPEDRSSQRSTADLRFRRLPAPAQRYRTSLEVRRQVYRVATLLNGSGEPHVRLLWQCA